MGDTEKAQNIEISNNKPKEKLSPEVEEALREDQNAALIDALRDAALEEGFKVTDDEIQEAIKESRKPELQEIPK